MKLTQVIVGTIYTLIFFPLVLRVYFLYKIHSALKALSSMLWISGLTYRYRGLWICNFFVGSNPLCVYIQSEVFEVVRDDYVYLPHTVTVGSRVYFFPGPVRQVPNLQTRVYRNEKCHQRAYTQNTRELCQDIGTSNPLASLVLCFYLFIFLTFMRTDCPGSLSFPRPLY